MPASRLRQPPSSSRDQRRTHWLGRSTVSQEPDPQLAPVCRSRADRRLVAAGVGRPASSSCGGARRSSTLTRPGVAASICPR